MIYVTQNILHHYKNQSFTRIQLPIFQNKYKFFSILFSSTHLLRKYNMLIYNKGFVNMFYPNSFRKLHFFFNNFFVSIHSFDIFLSSIKSDLFFTTSKHARSSIFFLPSSPIFYFQKFPPFLSSFFSEKKDENFFCVLPFFFIFKFLFIFSKISLLPYNVNTKSAFFSKI